MHFRAGFTSLRAKLAWLPFRLPFTGCSQLKAKTFRSAFPLQTHRQRKSIHGIYGRLPFRVEDVPTSSVPFVTHTHTHTVLALAFRLFFLVEGASPSMVLPLLSGPLNGWLLLDEKTLHRHRLTVKNLTP